MTRKKRSELPARQAQVLTLISHGKTDKEIAVELAIKQCTVNHHVSRMLARLKASSRAHAVRLFFVDRV